MDKKRYYVTVDSGSIDGNKTDESFEFEIEATEEQVDRLQELFEDTSAAEEAAASHGMFPPLQAEPNHTVYDFRFSEVYRMLHELGTPETQAHIEKMNAPIAPL